MYWKNNNQNSTAMKKIIFFVLLIASIFKANAQVEIIAHRGASFIAPENTVASSKLAWELGADAVETDIYLSGDKRIMCIHDENTKRTAGEEYNVSVTGSVILRNLDAGSFKGDSYAGEKIPFLEEIINEVPKGKELVVELKCGTEVLPYLKDAVKKYGRKKQFTFIAFDLNTIKETKRFFKRNSCYWLCSKEELLASNFIAVKEAGLDGVSLSYSIISESVIAQARNLNLKVYSWTVDDPDEAKRLISLGVKGITTNRPGWLNKQIF
jgi:glycerophosphoryl diester phosphodiesterase